MMLRGTWAGTWAVVFTLGLAAGVARGEQAVVIAADIPGAGRLAAPPTGQTLSILDEQARTVTAVDPFAPEKRWRVIGPADLDAGAAAPARPVAIACIDSNTLAVVCRAGSAWSLRAFRLGPRGDDAARPVLLQALALGEGPDESATVDVFVSDTRDWLAVVGLPPPLPAALRAPIAGARLGNFSTRMCPTPAEGERWLAAVASPVDEWVVFSRSAAAGPGRTMLTFLDNAGRERLLDLDLGLTAIRDAAFCRGTGTLWVVADGAETGSTGLWRIDAALDRGRQVARPVAIATLKNPVAVACLSERAIAISGGGADRRVLLVNPTELSEASP
jgi:hypothetical protein